MLHRGQGDDFIVESGLWYLRTSDWDKPKGCKDIAWNFVDEEVTEGPIDVYQVFMQNGNGMTPTIRSSTVPNGDRPVSDRDASDTRNGPGYFFRPGDRGDSGRSTENYGCAGLVTEIEANATCAYVVARGSAGRDLLMTENDILGVDLDGDEATAAFGELLVGTFHMH